VGHVYVDAEVFARRRTKVRFLVDTGATYTILPTTVARTAGATPLPTRFGVSLADGSRRNLRACTMGIEIAGRTAPMTAFLLPRGEPLLGVETLEALGLRVNPVSRRLEPTRARTALLVGVRPRPERGGRSPAGRRRV
jgi:predicted aspartyl protease